MGEKYESPHKTTVDKARSCLKCDRMFPSNGPHNRICPKCESSASLEESGSRRVKSGAWKRQKKSVGER